MGTAERKDQNIETYPVVASVTVGPPPWPNIITKIFETTPPLTCERYIPVLCPESRNQTTFANWESMRDGERVESERKTRSRNRKIPPSLSPCWRFRVISTHAAFRYPVAEKYLEHLHESSSMDRLEMSVLMRASSAIIFHKVVSCFYINNVSYSLMPWKRVAEKKYKKCNTYILKIYLPPVISSLKLRRNLIFHDF